MSNGNVSELIVIGTYREHISKRRRMPRHTVIGTCVDCKRLTTAPTNLQCSKVSKVSKVIKVSIFIIPILKIVNFQCHAR